MKKINYNFLIILLVIIVIIFGGLIFYKKVDISSIYSQIIKTDTIEEKENKINKKAEEEFEQCKQELTSLNNEQIVERINSEASGVPVYVFARLVNYFRCKVNKDYQSGEFMSFNQIAKKIDFNNVEFFNVNDLLEGDLDNLRNTSKEFNYKSSKIENTEVFFQEYQKEDLATLKRTVEMNLRFPIYDFIKSDLDKICPNNQEDEEILEWIVKYFSWNNENFKSDILLNLSGYCSEIELYSDEDELNEKVYNFKDWSEEDNLKAFQIEWKTLLAYRFGGREKSEGVCSNVSSQDSDFCKDIFKAYDLLVEIVSNYSEGCQDEYFKVIDGICRLISD